MTRYDRERDPVRIAGRRLRWGLRWIVLPAALGVFLSGNIDARSLPLIGPERLSAVLLLDGQAYFGHLDDSGESGTLVLHDAYYFQNASTAATNLSVGLVKRGTEAHEPADGMRINRDRVLAVERVGSHSPVAQAIDVERELSGSSVPAISLNRPAIAAADALAAQRIAAEHAIARSYGASVDQLGKLNDLVLPVSKAQAQALTAQAVADLRGVRLSALTGLGRALGMNAADADAYARATDSRVEGQSFANEPGVLLAPDLNALIARASALYAQVTDAAAKQLTQAPAPPSPSPAASSRP
ncbi:MAG: hypothetical protein M3P16_09955 [Chloroflexota bacterium]|nr:hypothetical protein [Chloroflexota bacterium]